MDVAAAGISGCHPKRVKSNRQASAGLRISTQAAHKVASDHPARNPKIPEGLKNSSGSGKKTARPGDIHSTRAPAVGASRSPARDDGSASKKFTGGSRALASQAGVLTFFLHTRLCSALQELLLKWSGSHLGWKLMFFKYAELCSSGVMATKACMVSHEKQATQATYMPAMEPA